jgi:flagellar assembly protein FliH
LERLELKAKEAFESGCIQGEQAARARYDEQIERMAQAVAQLASLRGETHHKAELELLELSVAIARRILRREVSVDPDALRGIVAIALAKLQSAEIYTVYVHPQLLQALTSLLARLAPERQIKLKSDAGLAIGALLFETEKGTLDVSIETQLKEVERGLIDKLTGGSR